VDAVFYAQDPFVTGSEQVPRVGTETGRKLGSGNALDGLSSGRHHGIGREGLSHWIPDSRGLMCSKNADQYIQRGWSEVRSQVITFVVDGDGRFSGSRCEVGKRW